MGRIVAIAGGDLDSIRKLNLHAIALTKKSYPNVLFIGTASRDSESYIQSITQEYNRFGCEAKSLCLITKSYEDGEIDALLAWADIIFVGGGDTISMMQIWKQHGLDQKLKTLYEKDLAVLTGISAGAICWFNCGHSDSESFHNQENWQFCWANGMLNLISMAYCPHYNEAGRNSFDAMLQQKDMVGIAMENDTAFVENNGQQYFIRSNPAAKAFCLQYQNNLLEKQEVLFENLD